MNAIAAGRAFMRYSGFVNRYIVIRDRVTRLRFASAWQANLEPQVTDLWIANPESKSALACGKMHRFSYRSPRTEVHESKIHGRGLFATADIAKNEIVAVKGGYIIDRKTLREKIAPVLGSVEIQIDDDLFIAPITGEERESSMLYSNHSCDANLGIRGEITFVAMRDIRAGEELTHDWATTDDDDYSVECKCGAPNCRKILTGKDWQLPELQKRYEGYFSAYLTRKVTMLDRRVK
jgi:hypothetical protein